MKAPIWTRERVTFVEGRIWKVYVECFKTRKHIYVKPKEYEFYTFDFILKGKEHNEDYMYHTQRVIKGL